MEIYFSLFLSDSSEFCWYGIVMDLTLPQSVFRDLKVPGTVMKCIHFIYFFTIHRGVSECLCFLSSFQFYFCTIQSISLTDLYNMVVLVCLNFTRKHLLLISVQLIMSSHIMMDSFKWTLTGAPISNLQSCNNRSTLWLKSWIDLLSDQTVVECRCSWGGTHLLCLISLLQYQW